MYPTVLDIYARITPEWAPCSKIGQKSGIPRPLLYSINYNEPITALLYWRHKGWRPYDVPYDSGALRTSLGCNKPFHVIAFSIMRMLRAGFVVGAYLSTAIISDLPWKYPTVAVFACQSGVFATNTAKSAEQAFFGCFGAHSSPKLLNQAPETIDWSNDFLW